MKKFYKQIKNTLIHIAKKFMLTKCLFEKSLHILEHDASGMQVGDIEQVII